MLAGPDADWPRLNAGRSLLGLLLSGALLCGASAASTFVALAQTPADTLTVESAVLGMTGWRTAPATVETTVLGMTGWRTAPVTVETAVLGMTGWRTVPATVETTVLGMTGWRTAPATVETTVLGMTGWRTAPVTVETAVLGMTGWRTAPVTVETAVLGMTGWRTGPEPPERTEPFKVTAASLILFHNGQPLPKKLEADCPVSVGHRALFATEGKLPANVTYHFEWTTGQRSTDYAKVDKGDRKEPLYEPPAAFHEFPYPLPTKDKAGGKPGPKGFAAEAQKQKGPAGEAAGQANEHNGSVRVVATNPYGTVASGWAPYHIVCRPKVEVLSGTLELRDPAGPACPRRAEAALSLKTNVGGPVPFSLDCTGDRSWSQTATAHRTGPGTYLAVAVLPFSIEHKEQVSCALKSPQQLPPKVLARRGHAFDCAKTGPYEVVAPPPTAVPPRVVVDPPRPACVGGRLLVTGTKGARYACHCPSGLTVVSAGPNSYLCQRKTTVDITCTGGTVRNGQCLCPSTMQKTQAGANVWRCQRRGTSAGPKSRPQ
jgi:hypothetical protein